MANQEINKVAVPLNNVFSQFDDHMDLDGNNNILFSGGYGIGKSHFLEKYFEKKHEDYNVISLSPVLYSTSNNDDIFELIKADIFIQLMKKGLLKIEKDESKNASLFEHLSIFLGRFAPIEDILPAFIKVVGDLGLSADTALMLSFLKLHTTINKQFTNWNESRNKNNDKEYKELIEYEKNISKKSGSPFENNLITQYINGILLNLEKIDKKENVLLIDDLDRLDPQHMFRILNVLIWRVSNAPK